MLDMMAATPADISQLIASMPDGIAPQHFYCVISQDIMIDPVKTIDGHTYDRAFILQWFKHAQTSPLTGLSLASTRLEPDVVLCKQINDFVSSHTFAAQPSSPAVAAKTAPATDYSTEAVATKELLW